MILYTSNGEVRQEFSIVLTARPIGGQPDAEQLSQPRSAGYASAEIQHYHMDGSMRIRIGHYLERERLACHH